MKLKLEDHCDFINGGSWTADEYSSTGFPVLKVSNFDKNSISFEDLSYLQVESYPKYTRNKLDLHDIVIATVGSHPSVVNSAAGRVITIPKSGKGLLLNQNAVCLKTKNPNLIDQRYLGYLCKSQVFQHFIQQRGKGAANQMRIPISGIKSFEFNFPGIESQRKIAAILSAYDDLIEKNLRRIQLLEEKAQLTYEEWIVRMKFPGHESTPINKETGLPEGWEKVFLKDIVKFQMGYSFKSEDFNSEGRGKKIVRIRNIPSSSSSDFTSEIVDNKYIVNKGDLLVGMDGEFYINNWYDKLAYLVQRVCNIQPLNRKHLAFVTESIRTPIRILQNSIDGATVAHLGKKHLDTIEIILPSNEKYFQLFEDLLLAKINISNQNQLLNEARDILLPRLMTGMIDVDALDLSAFEQEDQEEMLMAAEAEVRYNSKK
ncbi:type I restriction enzyme, S subunit [Cyclobacterium lianum]|uniref:Type I restriction enzyme, S subunit n=1 Tax=Cyclobacterium lianum TaxID=388280 RepID=A0A1M7M0J9_9BACT|nr:restriction endonuclease subunit S [Cyclobacterium lianum]SHM84150.1 type I restriction enzyme, S subunit [Cyclobacterium lianum]